MNDGLRAKYIVQKTETGETVENCFVLCPKRDWAARYAVKAYADMTCNMDLRKDLLKWMETFPLSSYDPEEAKIEQSKFQLKPCPRCGRKGLIIYEGPKYYYAECEYCPLELHDIYFSEEEAAAAWNYRVEESNAPLTLEELREMDGEPVWIRNHCSDAYTCRVIKSSDAHFTCFTDGCLLENRSYGSYWSAYRRKPEEAKSN